MSGRTSRPTVTDPPDPTDPDALARSWDGYRAGRARAYQGIDVEQLRDRIRAARSSSAGRLDELAETFARVARSRGVTVVRATSAQEVRDHVRDVCRAHGVRRVVKSRSMAAEEIRLRRYLQADGIECTETDLGEWIVQLCGQHPSRLVTPAVRLTEDQVADLYGQDVDERLSSAVPALVKVARDELRTRFLTADLGITGANVAVAETGTLAILSNEGNVGLVTTLPPVHIAVVGLEKLVATTADLVPIVQALPRSATGQLLTSYLSLISGPVENPDATPKELHVVLLDNQRSVTAEDPVFRQTLECIRCASCLHVCPVFRRVGGQASGDVHTGGIGTLLTSWFDQPGPSDDLQDLCASCGRCSQVCPARIDVAGLVLELRRRLAGQNGLGAVPKAVLAVLNERRLLHRILSLAAVLQRPLARTGDVRHLPPFLRR